MVWVKIQRSTISKYDDMCYKRDHKRVRGLNLDRITIHEQLRFNVKNSYEFLSNHMLLNLIVIFGYTIQI